MAKTINRLRLGDFPLKIVFSIDHKWSTRSFSSFLEIINVLYRITVLTEISDSDEIFPLNKAPIIYDPNWSALTGFSSRRSYARAFLESVKLIDDRIYIDLSRTEFYMSTVKSQRTRSLFLDVRSINYNSPGNIDLLGIGRFIESLFETIKYYFPNKRERLDAEIKKQEIIKLKIENLKRIGLTEIEIRKVILLNEKAHLQLKDMTEETKLIASVDLEEDY